MSTAAWAQTAPNVLKGKVKPGLYEDKVEIDMTGYPGIPKDQAKQVQTKQRCLTQEELDKGFKADKGCEHTNVKTTGDTVSFTSVCKAGSGAQSTDARITFTSGGFTTEMKSTATMSGKAYTSSMKSTSRYLGPCKS